jgi:putative SOS response-associated peptidase YedK
LDGKRLDLEAEFAARLEVVLEPRYNIAPTTPVLVVKASPQGRIATFHLWGLVPSWSKDPGIGAKLLNARSETAAEKPSFKHALKHRRCILPASGFYEWQPQGKGVKQPYWIHRKGGGLLAMAGLWETWQGPNGEELDTCTVLTTVPNEVMAPIHDRMPVLLGRGDYSAWLDGAHANLGLAMKLLRPCPAAWLEAYPVGQGVGNPRNEGVELIRPLAEP